MNERMLETRREQGRSMAAFLEANPKWVPKHYTFNDRKALVLSKGADTLDPKLLDEICKYQKEKVIFPDKSNLARSDCLLVTLDFDHAFSESDEFAGFRPMYDAKFIAFESASGEPPTFYKHLGERQKGFAWHQMNVLRRKDGVAETSAAIDLSATYNMDIEQGTMDVFIVVADTLEELSSTLQKITGVPWEAEIDEFDH